MKSKVATLEYDAETPRTQRNRKGLAFFLEPHHVRHDNVGRPARHQGNSLRILCDLCDFAFQVMNSKVATLEYDAETRRTQRKRKGLTSFWEFVI
jgi:hypothetical protein